MSNYDIFNLICFVLHMELYVFTFFSNVELVIPIHKSEDEFTVDRSNLRRTRDRPPTPMVIVHNKECGYFILWIVKRYISKNKYKQRY